jgi:hypothetical protein
MKGNTLIYIELPVLRTVKGHNTKERVMSVFTCDKICLGQWFNGSIVDPRTSKLWYKDNPKFSFNIDLPNKEIVKMLTELGAVFKFYEKSVFETK